MLPPFPSNVGKRGTLKDIHGKLQRFQITDEIRQVQSDYPEKVIYLQRVEFEQTGKIEFRLAYYIIGKKPAWQVDGFLANMRP